MLVIPVGGFFVSKAILFEGEETKVWDSQSHGPDSQPQLWQLIAKKKVQDDEKLSLAVWTPDPSDHTELYFLFRFLLTWKILLAF